MTLSALFRACLAVLLLAAFAPTSAAADDPAPPALVGRIATAEGAIEIRSSWDDAATAPLPNWPVAAHNVVATGDGRAEVQAGGASVRIAPDTTVEIGQLDDERLSLYLLRGSVNLRVRGGTLPAEVAVRTTQGRIVLVEPALTRIDAGDDERTTVAVYQGVAHVDGHGPAFDVAAGRRAEIAGGAVRLADAFDVGRDEFDRWSAERDRLFDQVGQAASGGYLPPGVAGTQELDRYGVWQQVPELGAVWIPYTVPASWAPYRDGRWAWVSPWGWTWIDAAPWGYAPSHYGRWTQVGGRWGWAPGWRPVDRRGAVWSWSPAAVGWLDGHDRRAGVPGSPAPAVGWYPLRPGERQTPWRPHRHERGAPLAVAPSTATQGDDAWHAPGVSVLPRGRFAAPGRSGVVTAAPLAAGSSAVLRSGSLPAAPPPAPATSQPRPPAISIVGGGSAGTSHGAASPPIRIRSVPTTPAMPTTSAMPAFPAASGVAGPSRSSAVPSIHQPAPSIVPSPVRPVQGGEHLRSSDAGVRTPSAHPRPGASLRSAPPAEAPDQGGAGLRSWSGGRGLSR